MKSRTFLLLAFFVPALLVAGVLSQKYKDWGSSPQAYFMTKAERLQWAMIFNDADAEKFINEFVAKRGEGFADQVADRVTNADKYLTIGKTMPASKTWRGKAIVLLGPPSAIKTATKKGRSDRTAPVGGYSGTSDVSGSGMGGGGQGATVGDMMQAAQQSDMSAKRTYIEYTLTYTGDKLPPAYASGMTIVIQADPSTGDDWIPIAKDEAKLNELFEAAAVARVAPAAKPAQ